jgi:RimJ/RimL family protein N-acetyltransferase
MLAVRVLPVAEWEKLKAIDPFTEAGLPESPEDWRILVVERDGEIVGTCSLFTAVHWDCWWIDAASRGKGSVLSLLLQASFALLADAGIQLVYTGVEDEKAELARLLERFGFAPAPGRLYVLPVGEARLALKEG